MMSALPARGAHAPKWLDSVLFLALMSGPPKFRERDPVASLTGVIDLVVVIHVAVWACGGLWLLARLYPSVVTRGVLPPVNRAQGIGATLIVALSLSAWESPGFLLTVFTLGQLTVMLGFVWVFTYRFGTSACLQHLFVGVAILALATAAAVYVAPDLVLDETRVRGDVFADTGSIAVIGLVLCLSSVPLLRGPLFWGALSLFGVLLGASRTRSAYVAFVVYLAIGFIYGKRLRVRNLVLPLAALAFSVFMFDALSSTTEYLVREPESIQNMSDRVPLWQYLTSVVMRDSPITGLGFYSASRVVATEYNPGLGNAHSVFFEVLVGGGILGAALYVVLCSSLLWFALRVLRVASGEPGAIASVGLLCVTLLMAITTSAPIQPGPLGFAFWSLTALLPALQRETARAGAIDRRPVARHRLLAGGRFGLARPGR